MKQIATNMERVYVKKACCYFNVGYSSDIKQYKTMQLAVAQTASSYICLEGDEQTQSEGSIWSLTNHCQKASPLFLGGGSS